MNKSKLSNNQMFAITANFTIGISLISVSSNATALAFQDAWISALITPIIGLPFIWLYYYLGKQYPGKTLIDIFKSAFGKWLGWIISAFFVVFVCFLNASEVVFYIGSFIQSEYMTETPLYALNLLMAIGIVIGLIYGLEAIARSAEIFVKLIMVLIVLATLLNLPNIQIDYLLPIFERGITPILKGSLILTSYITWPFIVLLMIYPSSTDQTIETRNSLFFGYLLGAAISFICTIMPLLVLGSKIAAQSAYPTYLLAKEINVGIINRVEAIISFSWIVSEFIRAVVFFYAGMMGLCQLFKINNYKRIVLPLGLVVLIYSGVVYPDAAYQAKWDSFTWVPFIATFGAIMPILILIITRIKKRMDSSIST